MNKYMVLDMETEEVYEANKEKLIWDIINETNWDKDKVEYDLEHSSIYNPVVFGTYEAWKKE